MNEEPIWVRYWRSTRIPLAFSAAFSIYATALYRGDGQARFGLPLSSVLLVYLFAALGTGLLITLFGKWASSRLKGALLGFIGGALLVLALNFTLVPSLLPGSLNLRQLLFAMIIAGLFPGAFVGALFWEPRANEGLHRS